MQSVAGVVVHPNYYPPGVFHDLATLILSRLGRVLSTIHSLNTMLSPADLSKPNIGLACLPEPADTFLLDQVPPALCCSVSVCSAWWRAGARRRSPVRARYCPALCTAGCTAAVQAARLRKIRVPVVEHRACQARLQADRLGSRYSRRWQHRPFSRGGAVQVPTAPELPLRGGRDRPGRLHRGRRGAPRLSSGGGAGQADTGGTLASYWSVRSMIGVEVGVVSWGLGCGRAVPGVYAALQTDTDWVLDTVANYQGVRAAPVQQVWG